MVLWLNEKINNKSWQAFTEEVFYINDEECGIDEYTITRAFSHTFFKRFLGDEEREDIGDEDVCEYSEQNENWEYKSRILFYLYRLC